MKNLKTIEAKVKAILQKNEDARNDDMTLYLIVCNTYLKGAGAMPFAEVMEQYKYLGLPSFESVGRTRRKLQAKYYDFVNADSEDEFNAYIQKCKELALYETGVNAEYGDRLITLSTCEYSAQNGRLVVVAKKTA